MAMDIRDIFMVIRAKDQASRVITGLSRSASADFKRLQTAATLTAQRSAIDMQKVRQNYAQQILHQQKVLNGAIQQGNKTRASSAKSAIRDLRLMQQAEVLGIRQEQIMQKEIMLTARKHAEARAAARTARVEAARSAGQWVAVGAGMAIVGAAGVKALHSMAMGAVEFQREATLTLTQVAEMGHSTQELLQISANVATKVGAPYEQLQGALYDIFSSTNVRVSESQGVLEKFAKAAVAGQVDVQAAGSATISIMNGYKKTAADLTNILDVQFAAVRLGRMTYDQFAAAIGKAIPSAVAANQSFETLAGSMAFLTRSGLTASQAAISFARLSDTFTRADVPGNLRKIGIEAYDAQGRMKPINVLLTEMAEKFKPLSATARAQLFAKIFGGQSTIQARRFFNLAINNAGELNKYINDVKDSSGEFGAAYGKMAETTAVKTELLKNNWIEFKRQIGEQATPALNTLLEIGLKVLRWLNDLSPGQKRVIASTVALVSVVVAASGVLLVLSGTVRMVAAGLGILRLSAEGATGALSKLGGASVTARLGLAGLLATVVALAAIKMKDELEKAAEANEKYGRTAVVGGKGGQLFAQRLGELDDKARTNTATIDANKFSVDKATTARHQALGSIKSTTGELGKNSKALGENKQAVDKVSEAVKLTLPAFEAMGAKAKLTASEITGDYRKMEQFYRDWSKNIQILIKRGVDPRFIRDLSKRGPEFVAAYANGTTAQVQRGERAWRQAHTAMAAASKQKLGTEAPKGAVEYKKKHAEQLEAARRKHVEKMAAMERATTLSMRRAGEKVINFRQLTNTQLGKINNENVDVTGFAKIDWTSFNKSEKAHRKMYPFALGGVVPGHGVGDKTPILAEPGEFVVRKRAVQAVGVKNLETMNAMKFAEGGLVTTMRGFDATRRKLIGFARQVGPNLEGDVKGSLGGNIERKLDAYGERYAAAMLKKYTAAMSAVPGNFGSGSWMRAIRELRADKVPFNVISTFRRGARTRASGSVSFHALNRAVDLTGPNMLAIFNALVDTNPTELIYSRASRYKSRSGWHPISRLDSITRADHYSHVHAAYRNGAWRTRRGPAYMHDDEMVLPKTLADPLRAKLSSGSTTGRSGVVMYNTFNNNANPQQVAQQLGWELSSRI